MSLIGVIADTHGLLRPQAVEALRDSDLILHAGDVGRQEVLRDLRKLAPVVAVRGNNDREAWAARLPQATVVRAAGWDLYLLHIAGEADEVKATAADCVITGHSHKPSIDWRGGVLHLNPGSAGPRRFRLPVTVARIRSRKGRMVPEIIVLHG